MEPLQVQTLSAPSSRSRSPLLPRSPVGGGRKMNPGLPSPRSGRENIPPVHPNVQIDGPASPSLVKMAVATEAPRSETPAYGSSDSSVKVVVRIRPGSRHERGEGRIVQKISSNSLSVGDRMFTFDSVLGSEATQEDVFNLVGVPLVKNSLAGFNTSILSYGQTGSGKTYTMWGPPSAMVDGHSINSYQGIVPRIFRMLFSEISRRQENSEEKQINYQCRCSFLEIYNGQINDLLDPTQRNLQIRDDARNGFHVENLTDEYVTAVEDVTQLLVKGLSNRKVGTTSINSKSSRSHIVFTCIIESWCKGSSSNCFGSSKTSRISLVDLAGSDMDKPVGVSRHCIKEGRHVKKSIAKLGKLVNILAEQPAHPANDQKIPYMDSCLTHLLHESLGGNAKVTFLCAIFPNDRYKAGTLSTLRFGERAIHIQNKAVINEITEDDVNGLSDQIRQLKEELIRAKSYGGSSVGTDGGFFKQHNARDSLNLLRVSLNRSLILPHIDNDSEEEVDMDEEDVKELCVQLRNIDPSSEDNSEDISENKNSDESTDIKADVSIDLHSGVCCNQELIGSSLPVEVELKQVDSETSKSKECSKDGALPTCSPLDCQDASETGNEHQQQDSFSRSSLSIIPSQVPHDPTICESPTIYNKLRKGIISSSGCSVGDEEQCFTKCDHIRSSLQSSKICPTDSLAASLHRGLQIIDYHQRNSVVKKSFIGLSFEHLTSISRQSVDKVDAGVQTLLENGVSSPFLCSSCRKVDVSGSKLGHENLEMQIVPVNEAGTPEILNKQVVKDDNRREVELESLCAEQAATIKHLNHVVDQYKHELEQKSVEEQNNGPDILRLAGLTDGTPTMKEIKNEEALSLADGHVHLKYNHDDHHEVSEGRSSLKEETQTSFDVREREALLEEIQSLRNQLKSSYTDVSTDYSPLEQIRNGGSSINNRDEVEKERQKWTESESRWISLTEDLRLDLESNRRLAETKEMELNMEKKCTAELDDALKRSILAHARFVEHYAELQEKHDSLLWSHRKVMEGVAEVKKAAAKAGGKRAGSAFVSALAAELSTLRIEREKERAFLKEQNKGLRIQLRDTAEAVHAAGELLVRLREAEEAVSVTEEKYGRAQQEIEKMRRQMEKMKKKHAMEMVTMKHYLAESRLPESALEPFYLNESGKNAEDTRATPPAADDEQGWRTAFRPSYQ